MTSTGVRTLPVDAVADLIDREPHRVLIDVRSAAESAAGCIGSPIVVDFLDDGFADEVARLDPRLPYVVYCRSGNRSGQSLAVFEAAGFTDVVDLAGGVIAWEESGRALRFP